MLNAPKIIAHRGVRSQWPENSLSAFKAAVNLRGLDGVEFDVHLSADGQVVVCHDPVLERCTNGHGAVADYTAAELAKLRLKAFPHQDDSPLLGEGIPTLSQVLAVLADSNLELQIEIKTNAAGLPYPNLIEKVLAEVSRHQLHSRCLITSLMPEIMAQTRRLDSSIAMTAAVNNNALIIMGGMRQTLAKMLAWSPCFPAFDRNLLGALHAKGEIKRPDLHGFGVWTINDMQELRIALRLGFRHIVTDNAELALSLRQR